MAKVLVFGAKGQLGLALMEELKSSRFNRLGLDLPEYDICDRKQILEVFETEKPDMVVNASAYTAVDQAEKDRERAFDINSTGPAYLSEACSLYHIPLVHVSTDYVFDGRSRTPYAEDDPVNPMGVYGQSKWAGEEEVRQRLTNHIIIRTAWLYGIHGHNFVKTMIRLGREKETITVVDDQYGCPTFAGDLARAIVAILHEIIEKKSINWGTYHYSGLGETSWYGFSRKILEWAEDVLPLKVSRVDPIKTNDYPTAAPRPAYSVLNCDKIKTHFNIHPIPWQDRLKSTIANIIEHELNSHSGQV